jgi:hypothetical protein
VPLAVPSLHEHLERAPDLLERAVVRDPLLEGHEPIETLLDDVPRDLVREAGGARTGSRRVLERVRAVEARPLDDVERVLEVLLGLARATMTSVETPIQGTARGSPTTR